MQNLSVLVTGASGFVGSHLLERLISEGHSVVAMHNRPLNDEIRERFAKLSENNLSWLQADISSDNLSVACCGVEVVFHLAAFSTVSDDPHEVEKLHEVNVVGTTRLVKACKQAGVKHFIFVSSVAACESSSEKVIHEKNGYPITPYGKSKLEAESIALAMAGNGFEVTVLRPTALFGENHQGSVFELVKAVKNKRFVIFGSGQNRTNFYYIKDFIEVLMWAKNNEKAYGEVFIASDSPCTLDKLASSISEALQVKTFIPRVPIFIGWWLGGALDVISAITKRNLPLSRRRVAAMTRDVVYSNSKLCEAMHEGSSYGVVHGLRASIAWYRSQKLL